MPTAGARLPQDLPAKGMCIAVTAMLVAPAVVTSVFPFTVRAAGARRSLEEMPVESRMVLAARRGLGD